MPRPASETNQQAARRKWLKQAAAPGGWRSAASAALLAADAAGAIGFAGGLAGALTAWPQGPAAMAPWLVLGVASGLARGGFAWAGACLAARASARCRTALRRRAVVACLGLPPGGGQSAGETMTVAVDAVEQVEGYLSRFLPAQRAAGPVCLLILGATAIASPVCAAILAGTMIPFVVLMILAGGAAAGESRRQFTALSRLSGLFADRIRALPVVLAFQGEAGETRRLAVAADDVKQRTMAVLRVAFISSAGLEFFAALSVALVAVYAGFSLLGLLPFPAPEHLGLGQAFFALALAPEFYLPMRRLAAAYHDRQAAETAADQIMALEAAARTKPASRAALTRAPRIRFEDVTVRYPGEDSAALDALSFVAAPGEIVALLGPSGTGKTTALSLLLGLAPLAGGEVWIDDEPLSGLGSVAGSVAWMGQTPVIMPGSIGDNIALSRRDAPRQEVAAAAEQAGLCTLLKARAGGLDGIVDERGGGLSGGERRRIALARALLKRAPILLLDEPTAHLDAASEAALILAIRGAAQGRTTLIATHSAALAAIADRVVRL